MCWSGEASAVLATIGFAGTAYAAYKKEPAPLWISLGYFSLMEALQAFTYGVIDQCSLPSNQIATLLGYLHIAFQPFFVNAVSLHFINQNVARKIQLGVYIICFAASILSLLMLYPFEWAGHCIPGTPLCSEILCSVHGNWHIAWQIPINGINEFFAQHGFAIFRGGYLIYLLPGFIMPVLYGSWRFTLYHIMAGPLLARLLTDNMNEWPAVWCLLSIALLLIVIKTPVRGILYVRNWPLWRLFKQAHA